MRVVMLATLVLLTSCATSLMSHAPITRQVLLTSPPDAAYQQAAHALSTMGAHITSQDATTRTLSSELHGAVILNVSVDATSIVSVTGTLKPGKVVLGTMTEVDDYAALLTQDARHGR